MGTKSWQISRRNVLRGGGLALGLPLLDSMSWGADAKPEALPKRLLVSYIAYGVYDPQVKDGAHPEWSWFPCAKPGALTFNKSTAPFEPFKQSISYFRGLDHAGGYGLGGHSSGDIFATGANMSGTEKTNNISLDQFAAKANGHHTRYPSLVLGTEGGTGAYGSALTLSHYGPGRPIPAMHRPQEIFNLLFNPYAEKSVPQIRSQLKRTASVLDLLMEDAKSMTSRLGTEDQRKLDEYLDSVRAIEQRTERTSQWTQKPLAKVDSEKLKLEASYQDPLEYTRCMYDLLYLAFQTDSTRFASFMLESEVSTQNEVGKFATRVLNYKGQTHDIAHRRPAESGLWDHWRRTAARLLSRTPPENTGGRRHHARPNPRSLGFRAPPRLTQHEELPHSTRGGQCSGNQAWQAPYL